MKMKKLVACFLAVLLACLPAASCSNAAEAKHEPLTIITGRKDYVEFAKAFQKAYP